MKERKILCRTIILLRRVVHILGGAEVPVPVDVNLEKIPNKDDKQIRSPSPP